MSLRTLALFYRMTFASVASLRVEQKAMLHSHKSRHTVHLLCLLALFRVLISHSAVFTVTTTEDSGAGSLRQAIADANANAGPDIIEFNIEPAGEKTIRLADSALP